MYGDLKGGNVRKTWAWDSVRKTWAWDSVRRTWAWDSVRKTHCITHTALPNLIDSRIRSSRDFSVLFLISCFLHYF